MNSSPQRDVFIPIKKKLFYVLTLARGVMRKLGVLKLFKGISIDENIAHKTHTPPPSSQQLCHIRSQHKKRNENEDMP